MSAVMRTLALVTLIVGSLAACKPKATPPICAEYAERADVLPDLRSLPADVWYSLLIEGVVRRPELQIPESPHECSGVALSSPPPPSDEPPPRLLPRPALSEDDVTLADLPDGQVLVWTRVDYFDDGTAMGPVALAVPVSRGIEIRGIGSLWAPHHRAKLRLEPFGEHAQLIVVEADICDPEGGCRRRTNLLSLEEQRIVQPKLLEDDVVVGRAEVAAYERHETPTEDGALRRAEIHRTLRIEGEQILIAETIAVAICQVDSTPPKCADLETVKHDRALVWKDGAFHTTKSVWGGLRGS